MSRWRWFSNPVCPAIFDFRSGMEESLARLTLKSDESNVLMLMVMKAVEVEAVVVELRLVDAIGSREAVCYLRQREMLAWIAQMLSTYIHIYIYIYI